MSYSVVLRSGDADILTLGSVGPLVAPNYDFEHDERSPPRTVSITKTLTIVGVYLGIASAIEASFAALDAALSDTANPIDEIVFKRNAVVIDRIGNNSLYTEFKILSVSESTQDDLRYRWQARLGLTLVASGRQVLDLSGDPISLQFSDSYNYSPSGLLTRTRSGQVQTVAGTSAEAVARTKGLTLPSSLFGYLTNGPEGVDVVIEDENDTIASFTSVIQESGEDLPADVSPAYVLSTTVDTVDGESITTVVVQAEGIGSEAAVDAARPSGTTSESKTVGPHQRSASAVYTTRSLARGLKLRQTRTFSITGGGRGVRFTQRTGNRPPVKHILPFREVQVLERVTIRVFGTVGTLTFSLPDALDLPQDGATEWPQSPTRVVIGKDRNGDEWSAIATRRYLTASTVALNLALSAGVQQVDDTGSNDPVADQQRTGGEFFRRTSSSLGSGTTAGPAGRLA